MGQQLARQALSWFKLMPFRSKRNYVLSRAAILAADATERSGVLRGKRDFSLTWQSAGKHHCGCDLIHRIFRFFCSVPPTCLQYITCVTNRFPDRPPLKVKDVVGARAINIFDSVLLFVCSKFSVTNLVLLYNTT